jgi:hypothetical protein
VSFARRVKPPLVWLYLFLWVGLLFWGATAGWHSHACRNGLGDGLADGGDSALRHRVLVSREHVERDRSMTDR